MAARVCLSASTSLGQPADMSGRRPCPDHTTTQHNTPGCGALLETSIDIPSSSNTYQLTRATTRKRGGLTSWSVFAGSCVTRESCGGLRWWSRLQAYSSAVSSVCGPGDAVTCGPQAARQDTQSREWCGCYIWVQHVCMYLWHVSACDLWRKTAKPEWLGRGGGRTFRLTLPTARSRVADTVDGVPVFVADE